MPNIYTTSTLFSQFVEGYTFHFECSLADALGSGNNHTAIAYGVANGAFSFSDPATFETIGLSSKNWPNPDVPFDAACNAISDAQQRLLNILKNANYPALTAAAGSAAVVQYPLLYSCGGLSGVADQLALVFRLMYYAGVSSSFDVTACIPGQFVNAYGSYFTDSAGTINTSQAALLADLYCNSAANVRSQVILAYMGVSDVAGSPYRNLSWANYSAAADGNFSDMPTYQALFGNQQYIAVPEFQSVLSPASYLADLHKCEQSYVLKDSDASKAISFSYRRPDIAAINLADMNNTDAELPQLSIGINLLELQLQAQLSAKDVTEVAASGAGYSGEVQSSLDKMSYPLTAPFNYNLARTRSALVLARTSLADAWSAVCPSFVWQNSGDYGATSICAAIYRDRLGISSDLQQLLSAPTLNDETVVQARYGLSVSDDITDLATFQQKTGLSASQVEALLYGDLSDGEIDARIALANFYIDSDGAGLPPVEVDQESRKLVNTTIGRLDRMNRFIRLANVTGYPFVDLNSILSWVAGCMGAGPVDVLSAGQPRQAISFIARIKAIAGAHGLSTDACVGLVGLLRNYGQQNGASFLQRVFGPAAPGYGDTGCQDWIPDNTSANANLALTYQLMNSLGLSQNDLLALARYVAGAFGKSASDSIPLTQDFLSALYRPALAARLLGLRIQDVMFLLDTLDPQYGYAAFAGPFAKVKDSGYTVMLDAFEALSAYAAMLNGSGLTLDDVAFMANSAAYQTPQSVPGLTATLTLLTDVANAAGGTMLTAQAFSSWLNTQASAFLSEPDAIDTLYEQLQSQQVIDQSGVVLASSVDTAVSGAWFADASDGLQPPLDAAQLDALPSALDALLTEYQQQQNAAINGVLAQALGLSADVAQTAADWASLLTGASTEPGAGNALHILYSDTMAAVQAGESLGDLTADDIPTQTALYAALSRFATLVNALGLRRQEVAFLVGRQATELQPPAAGQPFGISPAAVRQVLALHRLAQRYSDTDNNLLAYLSGSSTASLATATGWNQSDIDALAGSWTGATTDAIAMTAAMQVCMELSRQAVLSVSALLAMGGYANTTGSASFAELAQQVEQAVYAANPDADAATVRAAMMLPVNESYRDVLVDALLYAFSTSQDAVLSGIRNVSELTEYLLFDVKVGGKFINSVVEEATNAYQMLFYRIIMQLEPLLSFNSPFFTESLWPWFRNYRVWEANRQVFVTPENYLEPDLRSNTSDVFTRFINNLQAGTITDDVVSSAFDTYVDDFSNIASLRIIGSNFTQKDSTNGTVQLIGQSHTSPVLYYYRTGTVSIDPDTGASAPTGWTPWSQITTSIPAQFISTVYAFNRLFVFWVEFGCTQDGSDSASQTYQATIKYCFNTLNGGWSAAQTVGSVNVGNALGSYGAYSASPDYNALNLYAGDGLTVVYALGGTANSANTNGVWQLYSISPTLAVTGGAELLLDGCPSDTLDPLLTGRGDESNPPSLAIDDTATPPVDGAVAYAVNAAQDAHLIHINTSPNFPEMATNARAVTFACWVQVKQWGNIEDGSLAINLFSQIGGETKYGVRLTPNRLVFGWDSPGSSKNGTPAGNRWLNGDQFSAVLQEGQWVFVAVSTECTGNGLVQINYAVALRDGDRLSTVGSSSFEVGGQYPFPFEVTDATQFTYGYMSLLGSDGYAMDGSIAQNEDFLISYITTANASCDVSDLLRRYSGLSAPLSPSSLPFTSLPAGSNATYVPNSNAALYILDAVGSQYLALPMPAYEESMWVATFNGQNAYTTFQCRPWRFIRLTSTSTAATFASAFLTGGVRQLLDTATQLTAESSFSALAPIAIPSPLTNEGATVATAPRAFWPVDDHIDLDGADSVYYWELFLFAPWLVAKTYHNVAAYDKAEAWYQYVFNPGKQSNAISVAEANQLRSDANANDLYWRFVGLRSYENPLLQSALCATGQAGAVQDLMDKPLQYDASGAGSAFTVSPTVSQALAAYYSDPFDPHAIASLRPASYQKAIVMHYVQNLLDWADALYTECTRETIVEASLLYMQASDLLGSQPDADGQFSAGTEELTLATIDGTYGSGAEIPEFLLGLEGSLSAIATPVAPTLDTSVPYNFIPGLYFGIPQNGQLLGFWSQASGRLGNIRNSLDINGNPLDLALFSPAVNAMSLVAGAAAGDLSAATNATQSAQAPAYRFNALLGLAREYTSTVVAFGQTLQGALERQDAEALAQLQTGQQSALLQMLVASKQAAIDQAQNNLGSIRQSMVSALTRYAYYSGLLSTDTPSTSTRSTSLTSSDAASSAFASTSQQTASDATTGASASISLAAAKSASANEGTGTSLSISSIALMASGVSAKGVGVGMWLFPNIFGMAEGGMQPGEAVNSVSEILSNTGWMLNTTAGMVQTAAEYARRKSDWLLEAQTAEADIGGLQAQYSAALNQLDMAKQDYEQLQTQIAQTQAIADFYTSKFTSEALYQWMSGQLSSTYYQAYRLALSTALAAQYALQYEKGLPMNSSLGIVNTTSWNNRYRGLLAGEGLMQSLNQLERYYVDNDARRFEIVKTVSLADLIAAQGSTLENELSKGDGGSVSFSLTESMYDKDYPGHYCRQIRSVSVSIPAVLGPYQDIHATLKQTSNSVVVSADIGAVQYLNDPATGSNANIRTIGAPSQAIAISNGFNDNGVFELSFEDPRYLPFEGTGAVSEWSLYISDLDTSLNDSPSMSISDIIVTLRYTALYSVSLDQSVRNAMKQANAPATA